MVIKNPLTFLSKDRFDIPAKTIYVRYFKKNYKTNWHKNLYLRHIEVWNNFNEVLNKGKKTKEAFLDDFNSLIYSLGKEGFLKEFPIKINDKFELINGSHRLAASIVLGKNAFAEVSKNPSKEGQKFCGYDYFKNRKKYIISEEELNYVKSGLEEIYLDEMAREYVKLRLLNKKIYIAIVYGKSIDKDNGEFAKKNILENFDIVYEKEIQLSNSGKECLIRQIYFGYKWLGHWRDMFAGCKEKSDNCFCKENKVVAILFEGKSKRNVLETKEKIRRFYGVGNHSIHTSDFYEETLHLANILFNKNSLFFINNSLPSDFYNFNKLISEYKNYVSLDNENFCITSSGSLASFGLRDVNDIDYLYLGKNDSYIDNKLINNHFSEDRFYCENFDDIIVNPQNHYWYMGLKFASLDVVKRMKERRMEEKDMEDLKMIDNIMRKFKNVS